MPMCTAREMRRLLAISLVLHDAGSELSIWLLGTSIEGSSCEASGLMIASAAWAIPAWRATVGSAARLLSRARP